ncbi:MAG: GTPase [Nanoarchaeota archaeon]|nr:GTPase [Nanoarchaeota archaeon]
MRVRYSFSSRHTGRARDSAKYRKQRQKYPDLLRKILEQSQIILEILDARFIEETRNKELEKEIMEKNKKIIYVINKSDLNPEMKDVPTPNAVVSCKNRKGIKNLRERIKIMASGIPKNEEGKIIVGVIGYPNTGKSSLINILIGRGSAGTGADAGFTKGIQKLRLSKDITLLDSPGVIPQKEYSSSDSGMISKNTKLGARSYSQIKNPEQAVDELNKEFPGMLEKYYNINANNDSENLLEILGKRKNFLLKGGIVNTDKAARLILKDWQEGKIKISY